MRINYFFRNQYYFGPSVIDYRPDRLTAQRLLHDGKDCVPHSFASRAQLEVDSFRMLPLLQRSTKRTPATRSKTLKG